MAIEGTLIASKMDELRQKIVLDDDVMKSFKVSLAFKDRFSVTNGMDWDASGEVMVTSSQDRTVYLYSIHKAGITNVLQSKKHGASGVRFTNEGPRHIVCSSSMDVHAASVKLWDTMENRYIRSFSLDAPVVKARGISPHPTRSLMLISTTNSICSLYAYDHSAPLATYKGTSIIGAFDRLGMTFAVSNSSHEKKTLSIYDISKYQAPLATFNLENILMRTEEVVSIDFNPNGRCLVLGTNYTRLICINTTNGALLFECSYADGASFIDRNSQCFPSISPDGRYLLCGRVDGSLSIWNFKGQCVSSFLGHKGPPFFACFNPKKALISSACVKVAWWQPMINNTNDHPS